MLKTSHEIRDPVHVFIRLDSEERKVVDSEPFQRLRHIHQLAMTYQVYPGATHRRFEHSLGCMELASRIFDTITREDNIQKLPEDVRDRLPEIHDKGRLSYWRKTLRMAALCHDLGHLPFSHAAEGLLPKGVSHETMTKRFILEEMQDVWGNAHKPRPEAELVAKIAVGRKEAPELEPFSAWERILSEIITGEVFGADRMDYLLRDSLHAGVTYGRFDHHRLIDTMRILPGVAQDESQKYSPEPELGIELGGLQVAESLLVARYLMFSQVYFHAIRRIYDLHLEAFLRESLPGGVYPTELKDFLAITDNEILVRIREAACNPSLPGHAHAERIYRRTHFKKAYATMAQDLAQNPEVLEDITRGLEKEVGAENVLVDKTAKPTASRDDFPIRNSNDRIISARSQSKVLFSLPEATAWYLFVAPELRDRACAWVKKNVDDYLNPRTECHD